MSEPWKIEITGPAQRAMDSKLASGVTWAAEAFIYERLPVNPHRIGKPLRTPYEGLYAAHLGSYRVFYQILEDSHTVRVIDVVFRGTAYRRRG